MSKENEIQSINVGDITVSEKECIYIAGPCAVESSEQTFTTVQHVTKSGASFIRGGAFKPRTSPLSFQGLEVKGLEILFAAAKELNVPAVTEVMDSSQIDFIINAAKGHPFIFQVGSRNAQNYSLLSSVGKKGYPVLLKRGKGSTVEEMIGSADYIRKEGSPVIMCERGIVTFSSSAGTGRFTADHLAVIKFQQSGYLTIFDPSHAAGESSLVTPLALSGIAVGANGLMVEVHNDPKNALSDGKQALSFEQFTELINKAKAIFRVRYGDLVTA